MKKYIIPVAILLVALFLLWKGCHKVPRETVTPVKILIHDTVQDNRQIKHISDSFTRVLNKQEQEYNLTYKGFLELSAENEVLANENRLLSEPIPDTCQRLNKAWQDKYNTFAQQTGKTKQAATRTIQGLQSTVKTQTAYLKAKDTALAIKQRSLTECLAGYKALEKSQPRAEINIGVSGLLNYGLSEAAGGVVIGYRSRKGWDVSVGVYTSKVGVLTVKKTLFKL